MFVFKLLDCQKKLAFVDFWLILASFVVQRIIFKIFRKYIRNVHSFLVLSQATFCQKRQAS
ncbi:MAG: hypothetical protein DA408_17270 [Bacteroidetes bacterium]|nr:MAG: hypothetical protein C7N36_05230 [Bacteroidota bacterium]PTM09922.1 MAG: hypothetical protein DA408_17270 [Bacteroidota bacterium]